MGCFFSTNSTNKPTSSPSMSNSELNPDLTSYQEACRSDPELQSFDSTLQDRTTRVINTLAVGVEVRSLSLDSLRQVTGSLLDMNQEVVKVILECKKDIWDNDQLFSLVEDYFEISSQTLDFCTSLENCLKNARSSLSFLQIAIKRYDADANHINSLEQFKEFRALDSPFSNEFFELFQSVYKKQLTMLKKLQIQKGKVDNKLKSIKTWRRLSNVIFVTTFSTVLICSVVAAAVTAPPLVTALAAAMAVPLGSMGKWVNSLWKKYEKEFRDQREMMSAMQIGNYIVIKDLDNIKALVDKLGTEMENMLQNAEFAIREEEEEAVGMVVDEMKNTMKEFARTMEELSDHSDKCRRDIRRARTVVLQRIIKHPSSSESL
ncbi:UPF0496 protein 1-like [Cynara cardunculus var. scolymus]|uniref:Uncharacterized protein n=1 Tax=Cynara cardunculus var. scolymus TaxID=59895 RepID=A0A103YH55_CYNCS|nr:UPF0496 protein 1-like [Cynara cardunculus var. scolymus]KVI09014.1 Protein of unknown function DUF677 [Cynara cardunculus var. scolymus]